MPDWNRPVAPVFVRGDSLRVLRHVVRVIVSDFFS